ncbi:beta-ketoacyl synthase N-terminal-like domain-containing protein [Streptomyces sp. CA-251387]|uniref:beta-ketoacyl synthase N-terminal-like domain-containing protein n=1 Tax=Streptomyces sp. CA-251387 TaxID=3240064 RepID=UPI003D8BE3B4
MSFPTTSRTEIAIVGMAGRLPGADSVTELWQSLTEGREAVRLLSPVELQTAGVPEDLLSDPAYVPYGTLVSGVGEFDAAFFRMTPAEAALADPQHRLFMECAWRALEDAGAPPGGRTGVFASTGANSYLTQNVLPAGLYAGTDLPASVRLGNQVDYLASRVCHTLNLTGPAVAVQTACSSALVGVDAACTALATGRCDTAIAGAASLRLPHPAGYVYSEGGTFSRDGHCRPFDAAASGWVGGNGAGVVVLKRLADAVADRNRVYAVIRGIGVNNDGADKISFAAPSTSAQIDAITQAVTNADIPTTDIGYIEAHGSGTQLGDPIEVDALAKAYASAGGVADGCGLGSIKANLGHLDTAAGIASLIKAVLVLYHQSIPPQINYTIPNPLLHLEQQGFTVYDHLRSPAAPMKAAAVSSLGMGGTNVHMILSTRPETAPRPGPAEQDYQLYLSARTDADLRQTAHDLHAHLATHDVRIDDLAYTLAQGRARWPNSVTLHARTLDEARDALNRYLNGAANPLCATLTDPTAPSHAVKISLPGHPLHPERHWINPPAAQPYSPALAGQIVEDSADVPGDLVEQITGIFRTHLGADDFGPDDHFDAFGGSSITAVEIVDAIADQIGPVLGLGRFIGMGTPRRIAEEIRTWPAGNLVDPVMVPLRQGTPGQEVFFLYPANGTVFCYHKLAQHTRFARPAYAIGYPFEEDSPPTTLEKMAARCITEIRTVAPHGPYRLAGYSLGGNLAVEAARQLEQTGETVRDIVMIDGIPLEAYPRQFSETDYLRATPITLAYFLGLPLPDGTAETADEAMALLRQPTWSRTTEETMRRFVTMVVRTGMALSTAPRSLAINADITNLAATERRNPVYDVIGIKDLPPEAWQPYTTGNLTTVSLPGNHYTLYSDPDNFTRLAATLDQIYQ